MKQSDLFDITRNYHRGNQESTQAKGTAATRESGFSLEDT